MTVFISLIVAAGFLIAATVVHDVWSHGRKVRKWRTDRCLCCRFGLAGINATLHQGTVHERFRCFPVREFISPRGENV